MTNYGLLNVHSENSLNMSAASVEDIIKKAVSINANSVALTDNNTMTGSIDFYFKCLNNNINPIMGCELRVLDKELDYKANVVLLAKNYEGYQDICKAIYKANEVLMDGATEIYISFNNLSSIISNGNVIVLSGGSNGILGSIFYNNIVLGREINVLKKELQSYESPYDEAYIKNCELLEAHDRTIKVLEDKKKGLDKLVSKKYNMRIKGIQSLKNTDPELYENKLAEINYEMAESEAARIDADNLKAELTNTRKLRTIIQGKINKMKSGHKQYLNLEEIIRTKESMILDKDSVLNKCKLIISKYNNAFGTDFYIQLFDMKSDIFKEFMQNLISISKEYNYQLLATTSSYMINAGEENKLQIMRSLEDNSWKNIYEEDINSYIKTEEELKAEMSDIDEEITSNALYNIEKICNQCNMRFPEEKHFPKYVDDDGKVCANSSELLKQRSREGILKRGFTKETFTEEYQKAYFHQLNVITSMGFADYFLIVADIIKYGKELAKKKNEHHIGYGVGPGRGSVVGCLIAYLNEITDLDPIKYSLKFERFLNTDRVTMPDIDIDFSDEIRADAIEYVKYKYGKQSVALIRTLQTQQYKKSLDNAARLYGVINKNDYSDMSKSFKNMIDTFDASIAENEEDKKKYKTLKSKTDVILKPLKHAKKYEDGKNIFEMASAVENTITGLSIHAAGVIIGDGNPLCKYAPLLYNTSMNQWAVQCSMEEAEMINLLKMDFLCLKTLDIITECLRRIKKYTGITVDITNIPFEKEVFEEIFSKGNTDSVFQLESIGMKNTLRDLQPECFEDLVLLLAAYRPGPKDFIPDIIKVKKGEKTPEYCIPQLEDILKDTYGYPIYQEQIMDIFAICAGFTLNEADIIRRYMSKKKVDKFISYKDKFINGFLEHGADEKAAEDYWKSLVKFSEYGFNKSHACAYALIAYQTAYLKYHYKEYFMCAALNYADKFTDISLLLSNCRSMGIKVVLPDVNRAFADFENHEDTIIYGLCKIKGLKNEAKSIIEEREGSRFPNFKDFLYRTKYGIPTLTKMINAGVFDSFGHSREQLLYSLTSLTESVSTLKKEELILQKLEETYNSGEFVDNKAKAKCERDIQNSQNKIDEYKKMIKDYDLSREIEENPEYLKMEYDLLGDYISSHPLDTYVNVFKNSKITTIENFKEGNGTYAGLIQNIRYAKRKKDGKDMAFFEIMDITGVIQVNCFTEEYEKYKDLIRDNKVVRIYARAKSEPKFNNESEYENKLTVINIEKCIPEKKPILVSIPDPSFEALAYYTLKDYEEYDGHQIWLHFQHNGEVVIRNLKVSKKVFSINNPNITIKSLFLEK
mgnify:CR=1 FL=1